MESSILYLRKKFDSIKGVLREYLNDDSDDCMASYRGRPVVLDFGDIECDKSLYGFVYEQIREIDELVG